MELKYGKHSLNFEISKKNVLGTLTPINKPGESLTILLKKSIASPLGKSRLGHLLRKNKPRDIVIIVSDITRSIAHYADILKFLVTEIIDAGIDEKNIEFVIALGTHRIHTQKENNLLYSDLVNNFRFSSHDCYNNLISLGKTSTGLEVQVNKRVWEADFVIATGKIDFHYIAGFSGGRKSILPGISSYETIRNNHCKLRRDGVAVGVLKDNIIAQEMNEACSLLDIGYLLNVVESPNKQTLEFFWGSPEAAFMSGVEYLKTLRMVKIPEKADCVIISSGGYPQDKDFFNSHKSLCLGKNALKPNGSMILVVQCCEGFGNEKFLRYMLENSLDELLDYHETDIEIGGHRAFATAKILKKHKIYVLSDLDAETLRRMGFIPISNIEEAMKLVRNEYGDEFTTYIQPEGESVLPVFNEKELVDLPYKHPAYQSK